MANRELGAARSVLRQTKVMLAMKEQDADRYMKLDALLSRPCADPRDVFGDGVTQEQRRAAVAQALATEVSVVAPSRLLVLLGQALKWQQQQGLLPQGAAFDLFRGRAVRASGEERDECPSTLANTMRFGKKAHAESVVFMPDGQSLVTGSVDGFIEVWNYMTGQLRRDLKYQEEDRLMLMDEAVLCMHISRDGEMLATGSHNGKLWVRRGHGGRSSVVPAVLASAPVLRARVFRSSGGRCTRCGRSRRARLCVAWIVPMRPASRASSSTATVASCSPARLTIPHGTEQRACRSPPRPAARAFDFDMLIAACPHAAAAVQLCSLHGLKSARTLKEFRGHTSYVNDVLFTADARHAVSCSSDGTIRVRRTAARPRPAMRRCR